MVDSLKIRAARPDDVEPLTAIRREAILTLSSEEVGGGRARDWANSATPDRVCRAIEEHQVRVAEEAGQPVGWVEVERNRIEGMYVRPNHVRRGIRFHTAAQDVRPGAGNVEIKLEAIE